VWVVRHELPPNSKFCNECGAPVTGQRAEWSDVLRWSQRVIDLADEQ